MVLTLSHKLTVSFHTTMSLPDVNDPPPQSGITPMSGLSTITPKKSIPAFAAGINLSQEPRCRCHPIRSMLRAGSPCLMISRDYTLDNQGLYLLLKKRRYATARRCGFDPSERRLDMKLETLKDVLLFAVRKEHDSRELYLMFRDMVKDPGAKALLDDLAQQELGHQKMLEKAMESGVVERIGAKTDIQDLHIADYMVSGDISADSRPDDVMAYAIKMEQAAHNLYQFLLRNYKGTAIEGILSQLVKEELGHKETLEREYEEHFMYWM
jgi:rubrerythrin